MNLLVLAMVAIAEAVVYQKRYLATNGTPARAGAWTFAVCALRIVFVGVGLESLQSGESRLAVFCAYAGPAALITGLVRWLEIRRKE
jgi:succinate-acetate transporter protein